MEAQRPYSECLARLEPGRSECSTADNGRRRKPLRQRDGQPNAEGRYSSLKAPSTLPTASHFVFSFPQMCTFGSSNGCSARIFLPISKHAVATLSMEQLPSSLPERKSVDWSVLITAPRRTSLRRHTLGTSPKNRPPSCWIIALRYPGYRCGISLKSAASVSPTV
jgi:hypothetical protein